MFYRVANGDVCLCDTCIGLLGEYVSTTGLARPTTVLPANQQQSSTGSSPTIYTLFDNQLKASITL